MKSWVLCGPNIGARHVAQVQFMTTTLLGE